MYPELERTGLIDSLRNQNKEFKHLQDKHREYEIQLDELKGRVYLTPDQEFSRIEIKKRKLLIKDKMAMIIKDFLKTNSFELDTAPSKRSLV